jgi:hypothetical protein
VAMMMTGHKTRSVFDRYDIVSGSDLEEAARKLQRGNPKRCGKTSDSLTASRKLPSVRRVQLRVQFERRRGKAPRHSRGFPPPSTTRPPLRIRESYGLNQLQASVILRQVTWILTLRNAPQLPPESPRR